MKTGGHDGWLSGHDFFHGWLSGHTLDEAKELLLIQQPRINKLRDAAGYGVAEHICAFGPDHPELLLFALSLGATMKLDKLLSLVATKEKPNMIRYLLDMCCGETETATATSPLLIAAWPNRFCLKILLDAGANPQRIMIVFRSTKTWITGFLQARDQTRCVAIAVLGLKQCRSHVIGRHNGVDILLVVARCIWATRGFY